MPREHKVKTKPAMRPPHPGSILRLDVVPALHVSVAQAARELGVSRQLLHGILAEKLPVSAEVAVRLGKWCGNDDICGLPCSAITIFGRLSESSPAKFPASRPARRRRAIRWVSSEKN